MEQLGPQIEPLGIPKVISAVTCKHCGEEFESKGKYQVHYRNNHQEEVKSNDIQPGESSFKRDGRGKFSCPCGKSYLVWQNLDRHSKECIEWRDQWNTEIDSEHTEDGMISPPVGWHFISLRYSKGWALFQPWFYRTC